MEIDELANVHKAYLDTNLIIYFVEATEGRFESVRSCISTLEAAGVAVVTSELTVAECLFGPSKRGEKAVAELYEAFFAVDGDIGLLPLTGELARRAWAGLRD